MSGAARDLVLGTMDFEHMLYRKKQVFERSIQAIASCRDRCSTQVSTRRNVEGPGAGKRGPGIGLLWDALRGVGRQRRLGISVPPGAHSSVALVPIKNHCSGPQYPFHATSCLPQQTQAILFPWRHGAVGDALQGITRRQLVG